MDSCRDKQCEVVAIPKDSNILGATRFARRVALGVGSNRTVGPFDGYRYAL